MQNEKSQEYFIQVLSKNGIWKTVTKSYESVQLIEMAKQLAEKFKKQTYQVVDVSNKVLWLGNKKEKDVLISNNENVHVSDE